MTLHAPTGEIVTADIAENRASFTVPFGEGDFRPGESYIAGAVLTFSNNGRNYTVYSNAVALPMVAVHRMTFDDGIGGEVVMQEVVDGETSPLTGRQFL